MNRDDGGDGGDESEGASKEREEEGKDEQTNKQGKRELLSQWMLERWDEQHSFGLNIQYMLADTIIFKPILNVLGQFSSCQSKSQKE